MRQLIPVMTWSPKAVTEHHMPLDTEALLQSMLLLLIQIFLVALLQSVLLARAQTLAF